MFWKQIRALGAVRGGSWLMGAALLAGLMAGPTARAQDDGEAEKAPSLGGMSASSGLGFYFPDRWGLAQAGVRNPGDEPLHPRVRFFFKDQSERRFERQVWVPPRAQRRVAIPVRYAGPVDFSGEAKGKTPDTQTILLDGDAQRERELARSDSLGRVVERRMPFAMVTSLDQPREDHVVKTMGKVRERRRLPARMGYIRDQNLMRFESTWDGLEVVTLAASAPRLDGAQQRALRRWLSEGGTLVVFAHRADSPAISEWLGEDWGISQVDRVTLNTVRFRDAGAPKRAATAAGAATEGDERSSLTVEEPIAMARVIAPGYKASLTVRGWPALLEKRVGRGRIIVPTVGGRAWMDERATGALGVLTETVLGKPGDRPAEPAATRVVRSDAGRSFVSQQIGYQVVPRLTVALVLGGFIAALAGGTLLWMRSGRLERLGPFGIVAAVLAMAVLLTMGQRARQQIPPTRAGIQYLPAEPGADRVPVRGLMGLFDASGRARTVRSLDGGAPWPSMAGKFGGGTSLNVEDFDRSAWPDLSLSPAEVRWVEYSGAARLERPLAMNLRYGEGGLTGQIQTPTDRPFSDALLVTRRANLGVPIEQDSAEPGRARVRVNPEQVLQSGVLLTGARITKKQRERAALVKQLLQDVDFERPTLLAWSDGVNAQLEVEPDLTRKEQALWAIPVRPEPAEAGEPVRVPWPLVGMEPLHDRSSELGLTMRPIYSSGRGWTEEASGSTAFVARFQVPEAARPMELTEAVVHLNMTAIGRPVRILAVRDGQVNEIETINSPDGGSTVPIPGDALSFDEEGGLVVAFEVGDTSGGEGAQPGQRQEFQGSQFWTVRHFGVEVAGTKREDN